MVPQKSLQRLTAGLHAFLEVAVVRESGREFKLLVSQRDSESGLTQIQNSRSRK